MLPSRGGVEDGCCIISPLVEGSSSDEDIIAVVVVGVEGATYDDPRTHRPAHHQPTAPTPPFRPLRDGRLSHSQAAPEPKT
jgi:hypothetical protein